MSDTIELTYDQIIVGSSLPAYLYSYYTGIPIIYPNDYSAEPAPFEFFRPEVQMGSTYLPQELRVIKTLTGEKKIGNHKTELYKKMGFVLSLSGLVPFSNLAATIRIDEDENLKVVTSDSVVFKIEVQKILIFNPENISSGLTTDINYDDRIYLVYDWLDLTKTGFHSLDLIETYDKFVKEIWFYSNLPWAVPSRRKGVKNCIAVSYLTGKEKASGDFAQFYTKLKVQDILLNKARLRSKTRDRSRTDKKKYTFYNPVATHKLREERIYNEIGMKTGNDKISLIGLSAEKILAEFSQKEPFSECASYAENLMDCPETGKGKKGFPGIREQRRNGRIL